MLLSPECIQRMINVSEGVTESSAIWLCDIVLSLGDCFFAFGIPGSLDLT